jgi:hypothetical protein
LFENEGTLGRISKDLVFQRVFMTTEEQDIKREIDRIDWKISRWKAETQRRIDRKQREQHEAAMRPAYSLAWEAAVKWGIPPGSSEQELRRWQRHGVDLACEPPTVTIHWLARGRHSTALVGDSNALAHHRGRAVVCPPIVDEESYVVFLHEVAHLRDLVSTRKLLREIHAWRTARTWALTWSDEAQETMVRSLRSYIDVAKTEDVLDVLAAERFMSGFEYRAEKQRRLDLELGRRRR